MRRHTHHFHRWHVAHFLHRHEIEDHPVAQVKAGIGATFAISLVGVLAMLTGLPLLIAPFGATTVLLFGQPASPFSQPANIVGGYLTAAIIASAALSLFPGSWEAAAVAIGITIAVMATLRITHPPAGAIPLVAFASHFDLLMLAVVIVAGSIMLIAIGVLYHLIPPRQQYPLQAPQSPAASAALPLHHREEEAVSVGRGGRERDGRAIV